MQYRRLSLALSLSPSHSLSLSPSREHLNKPALLVCVCVRVCMRVCAEAGMGRDWFGSNSALAGDVNGRQTDAVPPR